MKFEHHAAVSVPLSAGIWYYTGNLYYFLMALFIGVFIDLDHIFDYIREEGSFDLKGLFIKSYKGDFKKLYLFLHCYEFIPLVWAISFFYGAFEFAAVFTIAYLAHMIPDQFANNTRPLGYFLIYRISVKFNNKKIFNTPKGGNHKF